MTHPLRLTYFDFDGGRGEPARIALTIGGIPFEDDRVALAKWASLKPSTPLGELPVLEVAGRRVCQSNAINRYVGRATGLYPEGALEALACDEAMDVVESFYAELSPSLHMSGLEERIAARTKLLEGKGGAHLRLLAELLERGGGEWFADGRLTVADLKVSGLSRHLSVGVLDGIPKDHLSTRHPTLAEHQARVAAHPGVVAYYAKRKQG